MDGREAELRALARCSVVLRRAVAVVVLASRSVPLLPLCLRMTLSANDALVRVASRRAIRCDGTRCSRRPMAAAAGVRANTCIPNAFQATAAVGDTSAGFVRGYSYYHCCLWHRDRRRCYCTLKTNERRARTDAQRKGTSDSVSENRHGLFGLPPVQAISHLPVCWIASLVPCWRRRSSLAAAGVLTASRGRLQSILIRACSSVGCDGRTHTLRC